MSFFVAAAVETLMISDNINASATTLKSSGGFNIVLDMGQTVCYGLTCTGPPGAVNIVVEIVHN